MVIDDITYPTVEHYFQAMKTLDIEKRKEIAAAPTPGKAKRMGRQVQLRADWENIRYNVMTYAIRRKFEDSILREKLLATGNAELIEGTTWHDNLWGRCSCDKCSRTMSLNWLGHILMKEREILDANT
jgi:ribA/ribD-fused uncharacterized protein